MEQKRENMSSKDCQNLRKVRITVLHPKLLHKCIIKCVEMLRLESPIMLQSSEKDG